MEHNIASGNLCNKLLVVLGLERGISAEPIFKKKIRGRGISMVSACALPLFPQVRGPLDVAEPTECT